MNGDQAVALAKEGKVIYREAWPTGTLLVQQGGYKASLDKWSDRSPLTKEVLNSVGITEELEIKPHLDMVTQFKTLEVGYTLTHDDRVAQDWKVYEAPQQQTNDTNTGNDSSTSGGAGTEGSNTESSEGTQSGGTQTDAPVN